ncbi:MULTISPECIES: phage late control D family protein [Rhodococcus]|uniref:Phage protein D-like protein n=1 Tax=Rhodococcus opacus RKJ300 = JCM 13270 TaxID=1165867 RepID=I0WDL8_RHOOP|nr:MULTISPECIES: phage late control D family protein [Rhodococcus]EID74484.1 Phage protein D-like protein [Rhodococcus opacus RKJ300 = JCM 13270]QQZ18451.1 phage late control D family protein [Rhodococcus sp. 21391]
MTVMPLYNANQSFYVPAFEIEVNGYPLPRNVVRDILEVTFEDSVDTMDSFSFVVNNWDTDRLRPQFIGEGADKEFWGLVQPGNGVNLSLGYRGERTDLRMMTRGFLSALDLDLPDAGSTRLTVRGLSVLDKLRDRQYTWSWPETGNGTTKDSLVAKDIGDAKGGAAGKPVLTGIERVRISDEALKDEPELDHVFMNNQYPIVFLLQLARRNGYDVYLKQCPDKKDELYFGPSGHVRDRTYLLEWGKTLTSLKASVSTVRQVKKVTVLGWDRVKKQAVKGEATIEADGAKLPATTRALARANGREEVVTDHVVATEKAAKNKAAELLNTIAARMVEIEGVVVGLPDLRAGRRVRIERVGPHLTGNYFVTSTKHVVNDTGYRTTFKARLEGDQKARS